MRGLVDGSSLRGGGHLTEEEREVLKIEEKKSLMIVKRSTFRVGPLVDYNHQPIVDGDG